MSFQCRVYFALTTCLELIGAMLLKHQEAGGRVWPGRNVFSELSSWSIRSRILKQSAGFSMPFYGCAEPGICWLASLMQVPDGCGIAWESFVMDAALTSCITREVLLFRDPVVTVMATSATLTQSCVDLERWSLEKPWKPL